MEDVMLHFNDQSLATSFLTKEDIKTMCPNALKSAPTNPNVSEYYVQANTETVIDDLARLNWFPVEAKQCRQKQGSSGIRSFHMIAFQNPDIAIVKDNGSGEVECYPRIILTNSHDGFNSFRFRIGLFRLICSNGLVLATDQMVDMSIRHRNYDFDELRKMVALACGQVEAQTKVMSEMNQTQLTEEEKLTFAESAYRIRKGVADGEKLEVPMDTLKSLLSPQRDEDKGNSLWNVFNVVQENIMKGGYIAKTAKGKERKQRGVTSVTRSLGVNVALFRSASSYIRQAV